MERLIIDTGVLVALERGGTPLADTIPDDADLALAAVTAAELLVGVELADDQRRPRRTASVEGMLAGIPVIPYDLTVAREHARLLAHTRRAGRPRGAHDLQIAATAAATRRAILTTDAQAFDGLPGIDARVVS
ncbi:MAG: PIN domain-containing protein [Solirubrobacteraceae bacterium]